MFESKSYITVEEDVIPAHVYVIQNQTDFVLKEMSKEILELHSTGILKVGYVREFSKLHCEVLDKNYALAIAETTITREILNRFVNSWLVY